MSSQPATIETDVPARLDRLPWARWHWLVVLSLGFVWILDGLEVTIVGAIGPTLQDKHTLALSSFEIGLAGAIYVAGGVLGALLFGYLTDRWGRKRLFMITLLVYLIATVATAFAWSPWSFLAFRFLAGTGIGGEYSAINSAIDELIPARVRGWVDLAINGSWWLGTTAGALLSIVMLDPKIFRIDLGWRLVFGLGAILGLGVLLTRRLLPESPRWLMIKGEKEAAERIVADIERQVKKSTGRELREPEGTIEVRPREATGFVTIARTLFGTYPGRTALGLTMMTAQAFAYNAVFFTYGIVLTTFMHVKPAHVGWYIVPFAIGNFLGPILLGPLFDRVGRRVMLTITHLAAGVILAVTAVLFQQGALGSYSLTALWCAVFFFASAAASAAYLTVSEVFPLEIRALAIAFFYAVGTAIGGITGPLLFGILVGSKSATGTMVGFLIAAAWLVGAAVTAYFLAVDAEQKPLEEIASPLSEADDGAGAERPAAGGRRHWSPRPAWSSSNDGPDRDRSREVEELAGAAGDAALPRRELARRAGARYWGPGRATPALREAERTGRIVRTGRRYTRGRDGSQPG